MPFAAPRIDDEEEKKQQEQGGGVNISGTSTSFDTVPGQEAAGGSKSQKSSGQYTNIQSYLDANRPQSDAMGQKIANDVTGKAQSAESKIGQFGSQQFKADAYDPTDALNRAESLNEQEKAQYKNVKQTGGYAGPSTIDQAQGYQDTQKDSQKAIQDVNNTKTEQGRQALLKQTYARPQYSAGENKLDQVLLQNSAGSKQALNETGNRFSGLQSYLDQTNQKIGQDINAAQTLAMQNREKFIPAEQQALRGLVDPIQQRADQANINNQALISRIDTDAADETLSDETLQLLGLSEGQNIYDLNLQSYLNKDYTQANLNNMANQGERGRYAALQSLLDDPSMNQISQDGRTLNPVGLSRERFEADLAKRKAEFEDAYNNGRGNILNNQYLYNPNATGGYNAYILGGHTDRRDLNTSTAKDLEDFWLPFFRQHDDNLGTGDAIARSLDDWSNTFGRNRTIKKG